jgi:hypothetical protein
LNINKGAKMMIKKFFVAIFLTGVFSFAAVGDAGAATFTVSNSNDAGAGSLRQAVLSANAAAGADTVIFDPAVFSTPQTITLASAIDIDGPGNDTITISGPGATLMTVSGNSATRIFSVGGGETAAIDNMTLTLGTPVNNGGAVQNSGTLTLTNVTIAASTAPNGGAIANPAGSTLNLITCNLSNNTALGGGGAIANSGTLSITGSTLSGNVAQAGGGAIRSDGGAANVTIDNSIFTNNTSRNGGSSPGGGAIYSSSITNITGSSFTGNTASSNTPASDSTSGGALLNEGQMTITGSTFTGNFATGSGGGVHNGANNAGQFVTINNSVISGNTANFDNNPAVGDGNGGGLSTEGGSTTSVIRTTISGNSALGNTTNLGNGGGIYAVGSISIFNSTVSGNSATRDGGGVIYATGGIIGSVTIVNNTAGGNAGGLASFIGATPIIVRNTIIANNTTAGTSPDLGGTITSEGFNLIENTTGATINGNTGGNITGVDPMLGPLANNGGTTLTHLPQPGSPVIDAGNSFVLPVDQRGQSRPLETTAPNAPGSDGADIGAVELLVPTAASVSVSGRVLDANGRPVARANVQLAQADGNIQRALTNGFGYYTFAEVGAGQSVILTVNSKQYQFPAEMITVNEEITGFDLIAFAPGLGKTGR